MKRVGPQDNPRVLNGSPVSTGVPFRTRGLAGSPRNASNSENGRAATPLASKKDKSAASEMSSSRSMEAVGALEMPLESSALWPWMHHPVNGSISHRKAKIQQMVHIWLRKLTLLCSQNCSPCTFEHRAAARSWG